MASIHYKLWIKLRVHLALNSSDLREYAIKILDINKIIKENLDKNLEKEVALMKKINHPNIVKLYEVMSTNQKILLVMEYIDGGDLFDTISILQDLTISNRSWT